LHYGQLSDPRRGRKEERCLDSYEDVTRSETAASSHFGTSCLQREQTCREVCCGYGGDQLASGNESLVRRWRGDRVQCSEDERLCPTAAGNFINGAITVHAHTW
jgi:hypothetical protein